LSTVSWKGIAENIIGIEPSGDMLKIAKQKADESTSFIKAYSNNTTLPNTCADAVICSQSFHWMGPITTLDEINRILKPNGIFQLLIAIGHQLQIGMPKKHIWNYI
jgi:ubiquinone/menaquinone biosynthesis C-methylase UbiE